MITANPAGSHDDRAGAQGKFAGDRTRALDSPWHIARFEDRSSHAVDRPVCEQELVHAVPKLEGDQFFPLGLSRPAHEGLEYARSGTPGDVKPRHGIAVAVRSIPPSLRPSDDRKPAHSLLIQPRPRLTRGKRHVGPRPLPGPIIFLAVESGRPHPVG